MVIGTVPHFKGILKIKILVLLIDLWRQWWPQYMVMVLMASVPIQLKLTNRCPGSSSSPITFTSTRRACWSSGVTPLFALDGFFHFSIKHWKNAPSLDFATHHGAYFIRWVWHQRFVYYRLNNTQSVNGLCIQYMINISMRCNRITIIKILFCCFS